MSRFPKILPPARAAATILALTAGAAFAGPPKPLVVTLPGLGPDGAIPEAHGFCVPGPDAPATGGPDRSPAVSWSAGPEGTRSYVLTASDGHVEISERPSDSPDAGVSGSVKAWVRALGPNADTGDLAFTGDRGLADAVIEGFVAAAGSAAAHAVA